MSHDQPHSQAAWEEKTAVTTFESSLHLFMFLYVQQISSMHILHIITRGENYLHCIPSGEIYKIPVHTSVFSEGDLSNSTKCELISFLYTGLSYVWLTPIHIQY